jgi:hypothetical protein
MTVDEKASLGISKVRYCLLSGPIRNYKKKKIKKKYLLNNPVRDRCCVHRYALDFFGTPMVPVRTIGYRQVHNPTPPDIGTLIHCDVDITTLS